MDTETFAGDTIASFKKGPQDVLGTRTRKRMGQRLLGIRSFFMNEAKERASGIVKRDSKPRLGSSKPGILDSTHGLVP